MSHHSNSSSRTAYKILLVCIYLVAEYLSCTAFFSYSTKLYRSGFSTYELIEQVGPQYLSAQRKCKNFAADAKFLSIWNCMMKDD
jgi:hypothetical protein